MASEYRQTNCNARDLAATLNGLIDGLGDGESITTFFITRLENNDDFLVTYYLDEGE